jgi:uncharacterized protein
MKRLLHSLKVCLIAALPIAAVSAEAAPKKLLVVTVTKGFRHSSIPTAEKILAELGEKSGVFTVDYVRNDEDMAKKMTMKSLKNYDGVIFANTTGDLPLPDKNGFLSWIKSGKAFIGIHSATDTFRGHTPLDPYVEMIGGEFKKHGPQVEVECINQDAKHPACKPFGNTFTVFDEIYQLTGFERSKVHGLLTLDKHPNDKTPGDYPISWCKEFGADATTKVSQRGGEKLARSETKTRPGRLFYTSLGHREDVWDPDWKEKGERKNSPEKARAYQAHIMGGIKWTLGLEEGSAQPQTAKKKSAFSSLAEWLSLR